jgi:hypothetical protein
MIVKKFSSAAIIALAITGVLLTVTTLAALTASQSVPLNGTIAGVNVGVYTDSACTIPCTSLNAGTLNPGGTFTQNIWIKNTGTVSETLTMAVDNWNPANANSSLTLTWNRQNYVLSSGANIQATLTLTAAANTGTLTTFSCSITITGTQ